MPKTKTELEACCPRHRQLVLDIEREVELVCAECGDELGIILQTKTVRVAISCAKCHTTRVAGFKPTRPHFDDPKPA